MRGTIGSLATTFALLAAAANVAIVVSVSHRPLDLQADDAFDVLPDARLIGAVLLAVLAVCLLPLALLPSDARLVRVTLSVLGATGAIAAVVSIWPHSGHPSVGRPRSPAAGVPQRSGTATAGAPAETRVSLLRRVSAAGLRLELHPEVWPSPSLRSFAARAHVGWGRPFVAFGPPFVAAASTGRPNGADRLAELLVRDGFRVRARGMHDGLAWVVADAPGGGSASADRVAATVRALGR